MLLYIASLNSGSNGNCYYIGNEDEAILVDAGISCRETEKRMNRLGLAIEKVKAIFISHEHSDHINGLQVLSKKYQLPVYITNKTLQNSRLVLDEKLIYSFVAYMPICIGALSVLAFPKRHDADDPHSFVISGNGVNIGVLTDIGSVCKHVKDNFLQCHAVFLEANYDEEMLMEGNYPYHLKRRISSNDGHLSNSQALDLFIKHRPAYMSHVILAHLSKDNNCPDKVLQLFSTQAGKTKVAVASRYNESEVFQVSSSYKIKLRNGLVASKQMSLFD
jgi:phosphoribosyl 1,2-cyclic phosphodiesterase